jgi:hypothetical protein
MATLPAARVTPRAMRRHADEVKREEVPTKLES